MASYFNSTTTIHTTSVLPSHITRPQALAFLHDPEGMIRMNPIVTSVTPLPATSSEAFYKSVPAEHQPDPSSTLPVPVFEVIEDITVETPEAQAAGNWRGGWAKRFIPDQIKYETSFEVLGDGMKSLTHAAMGVSSVTHWVVKDPEEGGDGGLVVEKLGSVTSNKMLMGFISTTLQESHEKLAADFVIAVERYVKGLEVSESDSGKAGSPDS